MRNNSVRKMALNGLMIALVFLATYFTRIPTPLPGGYFNLGDAIIMLAAALLGPVGGLIAGSIGSCFADLAAGALIYAPITLVVKGIEGLVVGLLTYKFARTKAESSNAGKLADGCNADVSNTNERMNGKQTDGLSTDGKQNDKQTDVSNMDGKMDEYNADGKKNGFNADGKQNDKQPDSFSDRLGLVFALVVGAVIMVTGYFSGEAFILSLFDKTFGIAAAAGELIANLMQGVLSAVVAYFLILILSKVDIQKYIV